MARRRRPWGPAVRRETEVSRTLARARGSARFTLQAAARALGVHPRTLKRWELGEARPRAIQWPRVLAFYAVHLPDAARALAGFVGQPDPTRASTARRDPARAAQVIADTADALDVAPRRVREVLRTAARSATKMQMPFDALLEAIEDERASSE